MKVSVFLALFVMSTGLMTAQDVQHPDVDGYVTRVVSPSDFDVNGIRILCGEKTRSQEPVLTWEPGRGDERVDIQGCPAHAPYLGEPMKVYGPIKKKEHMLEATLIDASRIKPGEISGSAVIDALPDGGAGGMRPDGLLVRADGYAIRIGPQTNVSWGGQLQGPNSVKAGDWIEYKASPAKDGEYVAEKANIFPVLISKGESRLREKTDFDPSAVPDDAKQNLFREAFIGIDPKRFPPYKDAAMQARVERIGERLIPGWNQEMPDSNPAKIHFRFEVVDTKLFRDAMTMPSGVILIPHQVVERMENDDELATVLADNIACALERQSYRVMPAAHAATAAMVGAEVAEVFVPGAGLAIGAATIGGASAVLKRQREQSGRVSLGLLKDAGYDVQQAPLAWWRLATLKQEPVTALTMPDRAAYLYKTIGENWNSRARQASTKP
jgi:hypothetical protein